MENQLINGILLNPEKKLRNIHDAKKKGKGALKQVIPTLNKKHKTRKRALENPEEESSEPEINEPSTKENKSKTKGIKMGS